MRALRLALRWAAAVLALCVAAWFVTQARDARELAQAHALLAGPGLPTTGQIHRLRRLLTQAKLLEPGEDTEVLRAQLALEEGRRGKAARILDAVLASEPSNLRAWVLLAEVDLNRASLELAVRHVAQLDPLR